MAEACISVDQNQFCCPICLDLLKDSVTTPCGHSYCMACINSCWDREDQGGVYSCPKCRETFTPRPVLRRNNILAEVVEKAKKKLRSASSAQCSSEPEDVDCDFCTGRKNKAIMSCLVCLASYCETHLQPHYTSPAFESHTLVKAFKQLQERICSQHKKLMELFCRTDQQFVCFLCSIDAHKQHDIVSAAAERTEQQSHLEALQRTSKYRIQQKEKRLQKIEQAVITLKSSADSAVENSERIFNDLISYIEKKRSEVSELIRVQEKTVLSSAEKILEQLEQEISDLKKRHTELEQLAHTEDHIHFLQSFQSMRVSSGCEDSFSMTAQHLSFDGLRTSLSDLKERLERFCRMELSKITSQAASVPKISPVQPKSREDFLQYFCWLTVDPNTLQNYLSLSENNRVVMCSKNVKSYSDHPERFDRFCQVLSKERVSGRCYWEVEWSGRECKFYIAVSYKGISRKGLGGVCWFGHNDQSWSLQCSPSLSFWHNNTETKISALPSSRIGVYVDQRAGTLSFYSVSDTMTLLHTVQTTFTQPLYAGFWFGNFGLTARLCNSL